MPAAFFPQDHTGELIAQGLREAMASWGLQEERLVCIATDNGYNDPLTQDLLNMASAGSPVQAKLHW